MILINLKRSERPVSLALILCLAFQCAVPYAGRSAPLSGGGGTVASSLSSMVDGYTGDFRYSVPLVTVPGPNGESVSISASYRAGIMVNQKASWIGLGWDYNPGEITRQVVNTPDDYNGETVVQSIMTNNGYTSNVKNTAMFGSMYNNNINRISYNTPTPNKKSGDNTTMYYNLSASQRQGMIQSIRTSSCGTGTGPQFDPTSNAEYRFNRHTVPYTSLAYDRYSVSGEGIGGAMRPYYLGDVEIHPEVNANTNNLPVSEKKYQFYFENSSMLSVSTTNYTNTAVVNQATNRIHSGTFVKYFTNNEINQNSNLYSHTNPSGYLDYKPVTDISAKRRLADYNHPDVIGAFAITTPAGMIYHYSLPVYEYENINASFDGKGNTSVTHLNSCMYATSWKLTAITGPDYEDTNGNYMADEGDTGYWISYNYSLWSTGYEWASQRYNAKTDGLISPKMINFVSITAVGNKYQRNNSLAFGRGDVYVLNYIKTATHTAHFVKSIRQDEQSYNLITGGDPVASLKLDRVILMRNENNHLLINSSNPLSGADLDSRFDYSTCTNALNDPNFVNITGYKANKLQIDAAALVSAELSSNYSLAKKYAGNINNSFSGSLRFFSPYGMPNHTTPLLSGSHYVQETGFLGSSAPTDNGKLTLKKITIYNLGGEKITPSVDFSYDENNSAKNPDFNVDKTDLWGYYKSDYVNSHYVTAVSKNDVDAWSLREINTSLGGTIRITYESDRYHKEGFNGDLPFYQIATGGGPAPVTSSNRPHLIFPFKQTGILSEVDLADNDFSVYYNSFSDPPGTGDYGIIHRLDRCNNPPSSHNDGNTYQRLIRYGGVVNYSSAGTPSTHANTWYFSGYNPEYDLGCPLPNQSFTSNLSEGLGVDHAVKFFAYLYGGGLRVQSIQVTEPFSNTSYTQTFDYGEGYCAIVPKPNAFSTDNGPSNHDVISNLKPLIAPQYTGMVGYNSCTQYSLNGKNERAGTIMMEYENELLNSPLQLTKAALTCFLRNRNTYGSFVTGDGACTPLPPGNAYYMDYAIEMNVSRGDLFQKLGKIKYMSDGLSSKTYKYKAYSIAENYHYPQLIEIKYPGRFIYERKPPEVNPCFSIWSFNKIDTYKHNMSAATDVFFALESVETKKDGIIIKEETGHEPYTAAPYYTKVIDPTRGVYISATSFAYLEKVPGGSALLYPAMDLRSRNENNRNLLTAVASTRTVKDNAYIISESKATYSNIYPVRVQVGSTTSYSTSNVVKPWYHLNETFERLLDDDVLTSTPATAADWRKLSTNTLYDDSYNCIEQEGLNGRKAASRWGYKGLYKLADISNANYNSFTFSGFEDPAIGQGTNNFIFGGEVHHAQTAQQASVHVSNGVSQVVVPHTGIRMAGVDPNALAPAFYTSGFEVGRTYIAKVWVHKLSPPSAALSIQLSGKTRSGNYTDTKTVMRNNPDNVTVGNWVLMSVELEVPVNFDISSTNQMSVLLSNTNGSGKAYFDDLAFHPKDAVMTGNVYNETTGALVARLDNDNFATLYNYDNALRLTSVVKEYSGGQKKITESSYHYAKP